MISVSFVLEGKPITERPKDSHDIIGVFRQALNPGWANQTLSYGEPVLNQLRERHADQMRERPEIGPGEFKTVANRAGSTEFVAPRLARGTLVEGSRLLPTVPAGTARALVAMFLVSEVHPFTDGNGRLARLVMNAELSVANSCRIIIPTLFREEYLDCLRVLTRDGDPKPFLDAMQWIHKWTASFEYENLDKTIAEMGACNAFEKSRTFYKLFFPSRA
ncbi:MAG: Fic family protein [Burkholderiaceae bacterium]